MTRILLLFAAFLPLLSLGCRQESIDTVELAASDRARVEDHIGIPAKAGTTKTWEAFQTEAPGGSPPETTWAGNVRHDRGAVAMAAVTGDIVATVRAVFDGDLVQNGDTLAGPVRATGTYTVTELFGNPVSGTFETSGQGRLEISPSGASHSGSFDGTGTGDLEGMKIHGTYQDVPGGFALEGNILDPQGRL